MLERIGWGVLWAVVAYIVGAVLTYALAMRLSSNAHDRPVEAGMTAAFLGGPLCAALAFVVAVAVARRR